MTKAWIPARDLVNRVREMPLPTDHDGNPYTAANAFFATSSGDLLSIQWEKRRADGTYSYHQAAPDDMVPVVGSAA